MRPTALEVYKIFEKLTGESQAKTVVEYFENADTSAIDRAVHLKIEHLATKEELGENSPKPNQNLLKQYT